MDLAGPIAAFYELKRTKSPYIGADECSSGKKICIFQSSIYNSLLKLSDIVLKYVKFNQNIASIKLLVYWINGSNETVY